MLLGGGTRTEPLEVPKLLGVGVRLVGADPASARAADVLGAGAVVLASALYAWGILHARRTFPRTGPVSLAAGSLLGGALAMAPAAAAGGWPARPSREAVGALWRCPCSAARWATCFATTWCST
ncbi:MAG: hypothetical protein RMM30_02785 [Armatimonadota bacterium]|nr:hypothetical protein [Armatimonadota bacterium]MDW8155496.1 hypothetical protein [Armatimonadota bacterium]